MGTGVADFEREMAEFLSTLAGSGGRPVMNVTRYPRSVPGVFPPIDSRVSIHAESRDGGVERLRVRERGPALMYALCVRCFERTDLTMSGREFCTGCANETEVVYVEPDYANSGARRLAQRLPNGKPMFMY